MELKDLPPKMRKQAAEKLAKQKPGKMEKKLKYNNKKTTVNGITFDSKREARRYMELKGMEDAGLIRNLHLQQQFVIQTGYMHSDGLKVPMQKYTADFAYVDKDGVYHVEDAKSPVTAKKADYRLRKGQLADMGIEIEEV